MSDLLLVEFGTAREAAAAARSAAKAGYAPDDVLSNFPLEDVAKSLSPPPEAAPIGWVMFVAGALGASGGYFMQWISAVVLYPIDAGGRPLDSWPAFLLVPYETAILSTAVVGVLSWIWMCGLTRLFHPLFAAPVVEKAVQDSYVVVFRKSDGLEPWIGSHLSPSAIHELPP